MNKEVANKELPVLLARGLLVCLVVLFIASINVDILIAGIVLFISIIVHELAHYFAAIFFVGKAKVNFRKGNLETTYDANPFVHKKVLLVGILSGIILLTVLTIWLLPWYYIIPLCFLYSYGCKHDYRELRKIGDLR